MSTPRREFTRAQRQQALERADWCCQAQDHGRSPAWQAFLAELEGIGVPGLLAGAEGTLENLEALWRAIDAARSRWPVAALRIVTRCKITQDLSVLEVDHDLENADGGEARPDNARVLCVICHQAKTVARLRQRTVRGPRLTGWKRPARRSA